MPAPRACLLGPPPSPAAAHARHQRCTARPAPAGLFEQLGNASARSPKVPAPVADGCAVHATSGLMQKSGQSGPRHRFAFAPPKPAFGLRMVGTFDCYAREVAALALFMCSCYVALAYHYNLRPLLLLQPLPLHAAEAFASLNLPRHATPLQYFTEYKPFVPYSHIHQPMSSLGDYYAVIHVDLPLHLVVVYHKLDADAGDGLAAGVVLVASPSMIENLPSMPPRSNIFYQSVVLLYEHEEEGGSLGIILNKPIQGIDLEHKKLPPTLRHPTPDASGLLGAIASEQIKPGDVLVGIQHRRLFLACALRWTPTICLCTDAAIQQLLPDGAESEAEEDCDCARWSKGDDVDGGSQLDATVEPEEDEPEWGEHTHHLLLGRAGWKAGQLARELEEGLWSLHRDAGSVLLTTPLTSLWQALSQVPQANDSNY
eukprot:SM000362S13796  [mRNA]  locus=s362:23661:26338:- [translate_table: standard]